MSTLCSGIYGERKRTDGLPRHTTRECQRRYTALRLDNTHCLASPGGGGRTGTKHRIHTQIYTHNVQAQLLLASLKGSTESQLDLHRSHALHQHTCVGLGGVRWASAHGTAHASSSLSSRGSGNVVDATTTPASATNWLDPLRSNKNSVPTARLLPRVRARADDRVDTHRRRPPLCLGMKTSGSTLLHSRLTAEPLPLPRPVSALPPI